MISRGISAVAQIEASSTKPARCIRVIVVDDHPAISQAIAVALRKEEGMVFCGHAGSAEAAIHLIATCKPDVAVVDLSLPDRYGLTLVSHLRTAFPDVRVVVFSTGRDTIFAERAIRAGALAYVSKVEPTAVVVEAIRTVYEGDVFLNKTLTLRLLSRMMKGAEPDPTQSSERLTDQELAVVHLLGMRHTVERIAEIMHLNFKTVQTYRRQAREKMGCATMGELLHRAMQWVNS